MLRGLVKEAGGYAPRNAGGEEGGLCLSVVVERMAEEVSRGSVRFPGGAPSIDSAVERCRRVAKRMGLASVPVGASDGKTMVPGTYRKVGESCPGNCPHMGRGCYAEEGNVRTHQMRARLERESSLVGASIAIVSALHFGWLARLHVSGDIMTIGERDEVKSVDLTYVLGLCEISRTARRLFGVERTAWVYTHAHEDIGVEGVRPFQGMLEGSGIACLLSDVWEVGGACTLPFERVPEMRAMTGLKLAKCPAQLSERMTCRECLLCPKAKELGVVIVFDPHGHRKRMVRETSLSLAFSEEPRH